MAESLWTPTGWIALWGAVIGTTSLIWNVRRDLVQRAKLKVTIGANPIITGSGVSAEPYLTFTLVNIGHRPITVVGISARVGRPATESTIIQFACDAALDDLPRRLNHSDRCLVGCRNVGILNDDLDQLWAVDSTGKHWLATRESMKAARRSRYWNRFHGRLQEIEP